ncbi:hypothetical protein DL771_003186 [Monosporascus sp. 5C6A]|nr:hypothetical protein DL771_003186 [Monosporascus sp. 5C6A]
MRSPSAQAYVEYRSDTARIAAEKTYLEKPTNLIHDAVKHVNVAFVMADPLPMSIEAPGNCVAAACAEYGIPMVVDSCSEMLGGRFKSVEDVPSILGPGVGSEERVRRGPARHLTDEDLRKRLGMPTALPIPGPQLWGVSARTIVS